MRGATGRCAGDEIGRRSPKRRGDDDDNDILRQDLGEHLALPHQQPLQKLGWNRGLGDVQVEVGDLVVCSLGVAVHHRLVLAVAEP